MTASRLLRVRLCLEGPLGTPLTSGTLFGHLCWAIRSGDGEGALRRWLESQEESPWLLSDGFPEGLLPRPVLPPVSRPAARDVAEAEAAKKRARLPWMSVDGFLQVRHALSDDALARYLSAGPAAPQSGRADWATLQQVRLAHNAIDRRRGTTPDEGGLYFVDEDWSFAVAPKRDVYVQSAATDEEVSALFGEVGRQGYGRDATWGRGRFAVGSVEAMPDLEADAGERRLSLSHGTITANMQDPRYRLYTHFGKVADAMAATGARVWKRPLLLARPGATFRPADAGPYGALLSEVHQDRPEIRHDARHLVIAYTEAHP